MNSWAKVNALKAGILKERRQRIRKTTYGYIAQLIINDTRIDHPFRDRMVLDWWHRVVDPLDSESFDKERLRYFRARLKEDHSALKWNAELRQGLATGKPLRRLNAEKRQYYRHQIARLSDRRLNYAAVEAAVDDNDTAFERLFIGLVALSKLTPGNGNWLGKVASKATRDQRALRLIDLLSDQDQALVPHMSNGEILKRIEQLKTPWDLIWYRPEEDYIATMREWGLIRKLEEEFTNYNK